MPRCSDWFTPLIALGSIVPLIGENERRPRPLVVAPSLPSDAPPWVQDEVAWKWGFGPARALAVPRQRKGIFAPTALRDD